MHVLIETGIEFPAQDDNKDAAQFISAPFVNMQSEKMSGKLEGLSVNRSELVARMAKN